MKDKINENQSLNAELKMIRELRKRIYGSTDSGPEFPYSDQNCVFCGSKNELQKYKDSFICQDCLSDFKK